MRLSIFGLGHVGAVAAGCLASLGHRIVGVDIDAAKLRALAEGRSPVAEPGVDELLQAAGRRRVSLLGLAFKAETGDTEGSPFLALARDLIEDGFDLRVFDPHVDFAGGPGGDDGSLAARAARSLEEALAHGETIVLGTRHSAFAGVGGMLKPSQVLVELG